MQPKQASVSPSGQSYGVGMNSTNAADQNIAAHIATVKNKKKKVSF